MLVMNLIEHCISTYKNTISRIVKLTLYIKKKLIWQKKYLSKLMKADIIMQCESLWSVKTRFLMKRNEQLRMVHAFILINDVIIKFNYSMKWLELILKNVTQLHIKYMFQTNAANEYWAVSLHKRHVYKTVFSTAIDQLCYLCMGQELTEVSEMYSRLKDIVMSQISESNKKPALADVISKKTIFSHFMNDNVNEENGFKTLFNLLHNHYFLYVHWSLLILSILKSQFFMSNIEPIE